MITTLDARCPLQDSRRAYGWFNKARLRFNHGVFMCSSITSRDGIIRDDVLIVL